MIHVRSILTILVAASAGTLNAAHISLNSQFGPNTITRDTSTGLEWLDLTVTQGLPSNDLELGPGGALFGFRYATGDEWFVFVEPYGIASITVPGILPDRAAGLAFFSLVGSTHAIGGGLGTTGLYGPVGDIINAASFAVFPDEIELDIQGVNFPYGGALTVGHFLVRTVVPEPSAIWLLCCGLGVFLAIRTQRWRRTACR